MLPDVYYHTGRSHSDQLEAVEAATRKVIEMGYVDPEVHRQQWLQLCGEGAAFIGTRSRLFAAVGVGAGVTDLYQDFRVQNRDGAIISRAAVAATAMISCHLYGQGRRGFSPWKKPDV